MFRIQSYPAKHFNNDIISFLLIGSKLMNINSLSNNIGYCHSRVKACIRILEYDLHLLTIWKHIYCNLLLTVKDYLIIIDDLTCSRLIQTQQSTSCCGLTTSGLSYKSKSLSFIYIKGYIINGLYIFLILTIATSREILFQVLYFN